MLFENRPLTICKDGNHPNALSNHTNHYLIYKFRLSNQIQGYNNETLKDNKINFVGLLFNDQQYLFSFPKHFRINRKHLKKEIKIVIKAILKSSNDVRATNNSMGKPIDTGYRGYPFSSSLWLYNQWKRNGLYKVSVNKYNTGFNGNIDWDYTINATQPYYINHQWMYLQPKEIKSYPKYNKISKLMDFAIAYTIKHFHWLFHFNYHPHFHYSTSLIKRRVQIIQFLKYYQNKIDDALHLQCIRHLLAFYEFVEFPGQYNIETYQFNLIWELAVNPYLSCYLDVGASINKDRPVFSKQPEKTAKFKHHKVFHIGTKYYPKVVQLKSIPDHFATVSNTSFIFDSKYYKYPPQDNYKQMDYQKEFGYLNGRTKCINSLVMPSEKKHAHAVRFIKFYNDLQEKESYWMWISFLNCKDVLSYYDKQGLTY